MAEIGGDSLFKPYWLRYPDALKRGKPTKWFPSFEKLTRKVFTEIVRKQYIRKIGGTYTSRRLHLLKIKPCLQNRTAPSSL